MGEKLVPHRNYFVVQALKFWRNVSSLSFPARKHGVECF
jgi:hypothetical protein